VPNVEAARKEEGTVDETRVVKLIRELDQTVPDRGGLIRVGDLSGEEGIPALYGNRIGYLRLAIGILKVADAPAGVEAPARVTMRLGGLVDGCGGVVEVEVDEGIKPEEPAGKAGFWSSLAAILVAGLVISSLLVGFVRVAGWVLGGIAWLFGAS
jgi:hypothetical protein